MIDWFLCNLHIDFRRLGGVEAGEAPGKVYRGGLYRTPTTAYLVPQKNFLRKRDC